MGDLTDKGQRRRVRGEQQRPDHRGVSHLQWGQLLYEVELSNKVEKILKGSPVLIPSPSPLVKIQIMGGKICLRCKGKTLLGIVCIQKFVDITQQCFALFPQVNFPANNLNFH